MTRMDPSRRESGLHRHYSITTQYFLAYLFTRELGNVPIYMPNLQDNTLNSYYITVKVAPIFFVCTCVLYEYNTK